ncbi:MAG: histidine phosphatase family protein [Phaeodactylibacter sp.]|nr:histidine phosphatase family protein [Phaeodactylibacter sp.]MCB9277009.1 histidine phosphatase family protein [Lewinellaceae bacterium]
MDKLVYIVRHGETEYNRLGIVQGQGVDTSLNERGLQQANAFFEHYRHEPFDLLLTSSLRRTHETMHSFIKQGLPWEQYPEINEISWGTHEGRHSTPEMRAEYRHTVEQWNQGNFLARLGDGENAEELSSRLSRFVGRLKQRTEKHILVCSHGRAMRCLACLMLDVPIQQMDKYKHHNTGLYLFRFQKGRFLLERENDIRHLEAAGLEMGS